MGALVGSCWTITEPLASDVARVAADPCFDAVVVGAGDYDPAFDEVAPRLCEGVFSAQH
jgi:hypothetical protein